MAADERAIVMILISVRYRYYVKSESKVSI